MSARASSVAIAADLLMYVAHEHPHEICEVITALLLEALRVGLLPDDPLGDQFVDALNDELAVMARRHGAPRAWRLVPYDTRCH
jgi:hypothetical protein